MGKILLTVILVISVLIGDTCSCEWIRVKATREGLVGGTTASGHVIKADDIFVALPSRKALGKTIEIAYREIIIAVPVFDVGPWYTKDAYWLKKVKIPLAAKNNGKVRPNCKHKYVINGAGIDLSDGLWKKLGLTKKTGHVFIKWRFKNNDGDSDAKKNRKRQLPRFYKTNPLNKKKRHKI